MIKEKNNDKIFREKLLNFEKAPPAHIFTNIASSVSAANRRKKIAFWRIVGVAAAILLAFITGWQLQLNTSKNIFSESTFISDLEKPGNNTELLDLEKPDLIAITEKTESGKIEDQNNTLAKQNIKTYSEENIDEKKSFSRKVSNTTENRSIEIIRPLKRIAFVIKKSLPETKLVSANNKPNELAISNFDKQLIEQNKSITIAENNESSARWIVGAMVSPSINYSNRDYSAQYSSNLLKSESGNKPELGGGISVEFKTAKRWSIQSGIYYSGIDEKSSNNSNSLNRENSFTAKGSYLLNTPVNVDVKGGTYTMNSVAGVIELSREVSGVTSGIALGTSMEDKSLSSTVIVNDSRIIQNFEYVEVPLIFRYMIIDSFINLEMLGGVSSNILVGNDIFMESNNNKLLVGKTKDMVNMSYSSTFGIGLKYGITKNIYLNVEPRFKYFLNSINSNSSVTYKPYSIGIYTGLSYEF